MHLWCLGNTYVYRFSWKYWKNKTNWTVTMYNSVGIGICFIWFWFSLKHGKWLEIMNSHRLVPNLGTSKRFLFMIPIPCSHHRTFVVFTMAQGPVVVYRCLSFFFMTMCCIFRFGLPLWCLQSLLKMSNSKQLFTCYTIFH